MTIRREPTHLSTEVWRGCWLIGQSIGDEMGRCLSADAIADTLLRRIITEEYPEVFEFRKKTDKMERDLIGELAAKNKKQEIIHK